MVPARNLLRRHYDSYGSCFGELHQPRQTMKVPLMAEDESKISTNEEQEDEEEEEEEEQTGTSSKEEEEEEEEEEDDDWLQLGIGGRNIKTQKMSGDESRRLMELPLFSDKPSGGGDGSRPIPNTSSFMPLFPAMGQQVRQPWGGLWTTTTTTTTTSSNPMFASSSNRYDYRHHQYMYPRSQVCLSEVSSPAITGLRIVNPPRRPQAGVWFILQTKQNQGREPFLPQIPKSYLRIKDGRMTIRLLKKYLVNKLGLEDESQVEITCRGQELLHSWTLQYVRDNVWFSGETMTVFLPESPVADQVMTLQYGRPARSI